MGACNSPKLAESEPVPFLRFFAHMGVSARRSQMKHDSVHAVVEVGHNVAKKTEGGLKVVKAVAASEAFRRYNWLKNAPVKNISGNMRGMVVNKRWATVFHFAE